MNQTTVDLTGFHFSSHLSLSSPAQITAAIETELLKSDLAGLRQCELIIYAKLEALFQYQDAQQRNVLDRLNIQAQIDKLESSLGFWAILPWLPWLRIDRDKLQRLYLDLKKLDANDFFISPLVRDALNELTTAKDIRHSILDRSPELDSYSDNLKMAMAAKPSVTPSLLPATSASVLFVAPPVSTSALAPLALYPR